LPHIIPPSFRNNVFSTVLQDGNTALISAAENGHLELVKVLVDAGADEEKENEVSIVVPYMKPWKYNNC
jgi:ankyrin repeat protein